VTEQAKPAMKDGIIKRGNTYSYVVRERDPQTGRTRPRWVGGFPTAKAAKAARDKARVNVSRGTYVAPTNATVAEWLDQWIAGHAIELKPSTEASYRAKIELYLKPALGAERLQALSPGRLSAVFKKLGESGGKAGRALSPRSVEYTRAILRKALADAVVERVIEVNPVTGSKAPRRDGKPKHVTWTADQQAKFLAADAGRWHPFWALALASGMRRGELCGLRWTDVDFAAGVVSVDRSTTQVGNERVTTTPKNHERRKVSIDETTLAILREWRKAQAAERLEWGPAYVDVEGVVFTREDGSPVMPDYLTKEFVRSQVGMGLPRLTLHGTRHSHATTLLREGVPVHIVSKRLGHKDASVTLNVYADAIPEDDDRAVAVFSRAVWGA
jgi:integrase